MYRILAILTLVLFSSFSYAQDVSKVVIRSVDGNRINLNEYVQEHSNVVVAVWQISCRPCLQEIPVLRRLILPKKDWQLVLLTTDTDYTKVSDFLTNTKREDWKVHFDSKTSMVRTFGIQSTPYTFVFKNKKLVKIYAGVFSEASLIKTIDQKE